METNFSLENETKTLKVESFLGNNAYLSGGWSINLIHNINDFYRSLPNSQDSEVFFSLKGELNSYNDDN